MQTVWIYINLYKKTVLLLNFGNKSFYKEAFNDDMSKSGKIIQLIIFFIIISIKTCAKDICRLHIKAISYQVNISKI